MTEENCRAVRAFTWHRLRGIVEDAPRLANIIADVTGRDTRWATGEASFVGVFVRVMQHRITDRHVP